MNSYKIVVMVGALVSASAFACPNLSGVYTCPDQQNGPQTVEITQTEENGITTYFQNGESLVSDNLVKPIPESADFKEGTMQAFCEGDALKVAVKGKVWDQGQFFGDLDVVSNYSLDADKNLVDTFDGSVKSAQGNYPINDLTTCVRQ